MKTSRCAIYGPATICVAVSFAYYAWMIPSPTMVNKAIERLELVLFGWRPAIWQISLLEYAVLSPPAFLGITCVWASVKNTDLALHTRLAISLLGASVAPLAFGGYVILLFFGLG